MNKICWAIENEFSRTRESKDDVKFNKNILKTNTGYSKKRYKEIKRIYEEYLDAMKSKAYKENSNKTDETEAISRNSVYMNHFINKCYEVCSNEEELSNIIVDLCFKSNSTKKFMWDICGEKIVDNLLKNNNYKSYYIQLDKDGDIEWQGFKFIEKMKTHTEVES